LTRLTGLSSRKVLRALQRAGFAVVSQKGSHIKLRRRTEHETFTVIVPAHREIKPSVIDSIIEMSGLSYETFIELLN